MTVACFPCSSQSAAWLGIISWCHEKCVQLSACDGFEGEVGQAEWGTKSSALPPPLQLRRGHACQMPAWRLFHWFFLLPLPWWANALQGVLVLGGGRGRNHRAHTAWHNPLCCGCPVPLHCFFSPCSSGLRHAAVRQCSDEANRGDALPPSPLTFSPLPLLLMQECIGQRELLFGLTLFFMVYSLAVVEKGRGLEL